MIIFHHMIILTMASAIISHIKMLIKYEQVHFTS